MKVIIATVQVMHNIMYKIKRECYGVHTYILHPCMHALTCIHVTVQLSLMKHMKC